MLMLRRRVRAKFRAGLILANCFAANFLVPLAAVADCHRALLGIESIFLDARDPDQKAKAGLLLERSKIALMLGTHVPEHLAVFLSPTDLRDFVTVGGRLPLPHFLEGQSLATPNAFARGVLELAQPGCPYCRSFHTSASSIDVQTQIFDHVLWHNDFYATAVQYRRIQADPVRASYLLSEKLKELYRTVGHDEVSMFFYWASGLLGLQDYPSGQVLRPDELRGKPRATRSVFQALVANPPVDLAPWKLELLSLLEQTVRVYPVTANLKIVNEGWAVMGQLMNTAWADGNTSTEALWNYASLLSRVIQPSLENPYWLGIEGWLRIWERFQEENGSRYASRLDLFRAFIEHAHSMMAVTTDREFLTMALDETWINRRRIYLSRPATKEEELPGLQPGPQEQQYVVVSRDPKLVRDQIRDHLALKERLYPSLAITWDRDDPSDHGDNDIRLEHELVGKRALSRESTPQLLLHIARTFDRSVTLKTHVPAAWASLGEKLEKTPADEIKAAMNEKPIFLPITITVSPDGQLHVARLEEGGPVDDEKLAPLFRSHLNAYQERLLGLHGYQPVTSLVQDYVSNTVQHPLGMDSFSADAILEYMAILEHGVAGALDKILSGQAKWDASRNSFKVAGIPRPPTPSFDPLTPDASTNDAPMPIDPGFGGLRLNLFDPRPPKNVDVGSGSRKTGDRFIGPKQTGSGGAGSGDGSGSGTGAGQGKENPLQIEIPVEVFGQHLASLMEIPNLETKGQQTDVASQLQIGKLRRPFGKLLRGPTAKRIIGKALAARERDGRSTDDVSIEELFEEGVRLFSPSDIVVRDRQNVTVPEMSIVVTFMIDLTGSMHGRGLEIARTIMFNTRAMLKARYQNVVIRYVGFSEAAHEYSEKEIETVFLNGGTNYQAGLLAAGKILDEYDPATWNRAFYIIGDLDDFSHNAATATKHMRTMIDPLEHSGVFHIPTGSGSGGTAWLEACEEFEQIKGRKFDYSKLDSADISAVKAGMMKMFRTGPLE